MEQLKDKCERCIEDFETAMKSDFKMEGDASALLEEYLPFFTGSEKQLNLVINGKKNSIHSKEEVMKLEKLHSAIKNLLQDTLLTSPSICNEDLMDILFQKSNVGNKLILKYKYV